MRRTKTILVMSPKQWHFITQREYAIEQHEQCRLTNVSVITGTSCMNKLEGK